MARPNGYRFAQNRERSEGPTVALGQKSSKRPSVRGRPCISRQVVVPHARSDCVGTSLLSSTNCGTRSERNEGPTVALAPLDATDDPSLRSGFRVSSSLISLPVQTRRSAYRPVHWFVTEDGTWEGRPREDPIGRVEMQRKTGLLS